MTTRSVWMRGAIISVLVAACASPRDVPPRRDTLVVAAPTRAGATPAPLANDAAAKDSLAARFRAFIGFTASSVAAELPELAMVAADGRRTGFDPATKRVLSQLPGADYSSEPGLADDDGASGDSASAASAGIETRVVDVPSHPGERYTLEVMASDPGTFMLDVALFRHDGRTSADTSMRTLSFGRGQVRRFAVRIGDGTMEVAEQR